MPQKTKWVPTGCTVVKREIEDSYDEKKKKHIRKITTEQECVLQKKVYNVPAKKKLTKERLMEIIKEEIESLRIVPKYSEMNDRDKKSELYPGYEELKKLSLGITEEEELDEICGDDVPGNRRHTKDGKFGSKKDNTSWSLQFQDCGASKMKPGSNVRRATKLPCGRKAREKGKNVRCRDGKVLEIDDCN